MYLCWLGAWHGGGEGQPGPGEGCATLASLVMASLRKHRAVHTETRLGRVFLGISVYFA